MEAERDAIASRWVEDLRGSTDANLITLRSLWRAAASIYHQQRRARGRVSGKGTMTCVGTGAEESEEKVHQAQVWTMVGTAGTKTKDDCLCPLRVHLLTTSNLNTLVSKQLR